MDGVFVGHHNVKSFLGFQYIPLQEMEARLFDPSLSGVRIFHACLALVEKILEAAVTLFPNQVR